MREHRVITSKVANLAQDSLIKEDVKCHTHVSSITYPPVLSSFPNKHFKVSYHLPQPPKCNVTKYYSRLS